jgi:hypothetical protein
MRPDGWPLFREDQWTPLRERACPGDAVPQFLGTLRVLPPTRCEQRPVRSRLPAWHTVRVLSAPRTKSARREIFPARASQARVPWPFTPAALVSLGAAHRHLAGQKGRGLLRAKPCFPADSSNPWRPGSRRLRRSSHGKTLLAAVAIPSIRIDRSTHERSQGPSSIVGVRAIRRRLGGRGGLSVSRGRDSARNLDRVTTFALRIIEIALPRRAGARVCAMGCYEWQFRQHLPQQSKSSRHLISASTRRPSKRPPTSWVRHNPCFVYQTQASPSLGTA